MTLLKSDNSSKEVLARNVMIVVTFSIFILLSASVFYSKLPIVESDEFAYISAAKYIAGWDKVDKIPENVFTGSVGYPIIISPAFMISHDPVTSFRFVLLINSLFAALMLPLLYLIGKQIFNLDGNKSLLIAIAASFFPSAMLQSNIAWTQTVSTTLFTLSILLFYQFLKKRDTKSQVYFIISIFFASIVHVRGLAVITGMLIILILFFLNDKQNRLRIVITASVLFVAYLISLTIADNIGRHIFDNSNGAVVIISKLSSRLEVVILGIFVMALFVFIYRKYYFALLCIVTALFCGFLVSLNFLLIGAFPIVLIGIILMRLSQKLSRQEFITSLVSFLLFALMTVLIFRSTQSYINAGYVAVYWLTNLSAKIYYLFTSSFIISGLGMTGIIIVVLKDLKSSDNKERDWVFGFIAITFAVTLFMINSQTKLDADYRPERLFYGRYIEMFIPIFMLAGFKFLITGEWKKRNFLIWSAIAFIIPLILIPSVYRYNFVSEPEFRNFFSFFPYKAILQSINLYVIAAISLIVFAVLVIILQKKFNLGIILYSLLLFSLSSFIFVYVIVYHQSERQANTRIAAVLNQIAPTDTVDYDVRIKSAGMPNRLIYQYLLQNVNFGFYNPNKNHQSGQFIIGTPYYKELNNQEAVLITSERASNECLWLTNDFNNKKYLPYMPSYLDLNLFDEAVLGVYKNGFDENGMIRGDAILKFPNYRKDIYDSLHIEVNVPVGQNTKFINIKINDSDSIRIPIENNKIDKTLKISSTNADRINLEISADTDNPAVIAKSLIFKGKYADAPLADFDYDGQVIFDIRNNFNLNRIHIKAGKNFILPIQFYSVRDRGGIGSVVVSWKDFVLQRKALLQNIDFRTQHDYLMDVTLKAPTKPGKYFLEFHQSSGEKIPLINMFGKNYYLVVVEP